MIIPSQTEYCGCTARVGMIIHHLELVHTRTINMLKHEKRALKEEIIPNFTGYPYSEVLREFAECDRIPESELNRLECHEEYYLEWNLNSFNDAELNDHLYRIYYPKRRYIAYYVNLYPKQITQKASNYLDSKKLMLNEWLKSVKEGRRGDIF